MDRVWTANLSIPQLEIDNSQFVSLSQFLAAAFDYFTSLFAGMIEAPVAIIRSLKEVELIARIEEQALPLEKLELFRFYIPQIARLAGENG